MPPRTKTQRNDREVFADGTNPDRLLALHPAAIGVAFRQRPAADVARVVNGVAVLCVDGPLEHKCRSWWGFWQNYERLVECFRSALLDPEVKAVMLKFDSPGGEVSGLTETVRIMQRAKEESGKRVIGYVDEDCFSAAYALGMVCDEIYLPESGGVGSIGVISAMVDVTAMDRKDGIRVEVIASGTKKADGHPHVPISEGALKRAQRRVDTLAEQFFALVSETRGIEVDDIAAMEAGVFFGHDAVDVGLADGVMTLDECLTLAANVFGSTENPTDRSVGEKETNPMTVLAATRALNEANAKLAAAKSDKDRAVAAARVVDAEDALATAKAEAKSNGEDAPAAKVKKMKTVVKDTHEEIVDDGEDEDDDEDDEDDEDDDDDASYDSDDDDAESNDTEDKAADRMPRPRAVRASAFDATPGGLLAFVRRMTGQKSIDAVMGALQAMADNHAKASTLSQKVAALESSARKSALATLIEKGMRAGKLTPGQRKWALTQTVASLKAYLATAPKMAHTEEDEHTEASADGNELGTVTAEMARIWRKQGHAESEFPRLLAAFNKDMKASKSAPKGSVN